MLRGWQATASSDPHALQLMKGRQRVMEAHDLARLWVVLEFGANWFVEERSGSTRRGKGRS